VVAPLRSALVRSAPLRSAPVRSAPLRFTPVRFASLRSAPVRFAPLRLWPVRFACLRSAPLRSWPLRSWPLGYSVTRCSLQGEAGPLDARMSIPGARVAKGPTTAGRTILRSGVNVLFGRWHFVARVLMASPLTETATFRGAPCRGKKSRVSLCYADARDRPQDHPQVRGADRGGGLRPRGTTGDHRGVGALRGQLGSRSWSSPSCAPSPSPGRQVSPQSRIVGIAPA
jgi:hypothetical protein